MARIITFCVFVWYILAFVAPLPFSYQGGNNYAYGEPQKQDYQSFGLPQQNYGQQSQYANSASSSAVVGNTYDTGNLNLQLPSQAQNTAYFKSPRKESYQNVLGPTIPSQQKIETDVASKIGKQQLIQELTNQIAAKRTISANQPVSSVAGSYVNNPVQSVNSPASQPAEVKTSGAAQENVNNPFKQLYQEVVQRPEQAIDSEFLKTWRQRLPVPGAQKPYLVIHSDGRTEYIDKIEDIKQKYPNFRLLKINQSPTINPVQASLSNIQQSNIQPVPPQSQTINRLVINPSQSQSSPRQIVQQEALQNVPQTQPNLPQENSQTKPENLQSNIETLSKIQSQSIASQVLNSNVKPAQQSVAQQTLIPRGQTVPQKQPQGVIQSLNSGPQNSLSSVILNSNDVQQQQVQLSNVKTVPQNHPHPVEQPSNSGPQNPLASTVLNSVSTQREPKPDDAAQKSPQIVPQLKPQPNDQPQGPQNPLASVLLNSTSTEPVQQSNKVEQQVKQSNVKPAVQTQPILNSVSTQRKPYSYNNVSPQNVPQPKPQPINQSSTQGPQNPLASVLLNSTAEKTVTEVKHAPLLNKEKLPQIQTQSAGQESLVKHSDSMAQETPKQSAAAPENDNLSNSKINSNVNAKSDEESLNKENKPSNSDEIQNSELSSLNKISVQSESSQQDSNDSNKYSKSEDSSKFDNTSTQDNENKSQYTSNNNQQKYLLDNSQELKQAHEQENQSKFDSSEQNSARSQTDDADNQAQSESTDQHQSHNDNQTDEHAKQPNPQTSKSTKGPESKHLNNIDGNTVNESNNAVTSSNNSGEKANLENSTENTSETKSVSLKQLGKFIVFDTTGLQSGDTDSEILANLIGDSPYSVIQFFLVKPERTIERNITRKVIDDEHYLEEIVQSETYGDAEPVISCETYVIDAPQKE